MSAEARTLCDAELYRIGKIKGKCAKFDLSRVSCEQFDSLIRTLKIRCAHEFYGLGLTFDLLNKTKTKNIQTEASKSETRTSKTRITQGSFALAMSAISKRRGVTAKIAKSIKEILEATETISFLKLRSITFMPNDILDLADAVYACNTIKSLRLCNIPLGDKGFSKLCRALKKKGVVDLQLRKCHLTDKCGPDMHSLISYHVSVQSECQWQESLAASGSFAPLVCLQTLDLRDNDFTYAFIREIFDPVLDLPLKILDFRGNPGISGTIVAELANQMPGTAIRTGLSKPIKESKPAKKPYKSKIGRKLMSSTSESRQTRSASSRTLRKENARLHNLVNTLENGGDIVELEPDLAIVGPRAQELAHHLIELDKMLEQLQIGRPSFLRDVPRKTKKLKTKGQRRMKKASNTNTKRKIARHVKHT